MTTQSGSAPGGWYADFEWSGSEDVLSGVAQDFRDLPGWFTNVNLAAPLASTSNQVALLEGQYLCEVFADYTAAVTSAFRVRLLGSGGSFSKDAIISAGTSGNHFIDSGLLTIYVAIPVLLSAGIFVTGAGTVNIDDLEVHISKIA